LRVERPPRTVSAISELRLPFGKHLIDGDTVIISPVGSAVPLGRRGLAVLVSCLLLLLIRLWRGRSSSLQSDDSIHLSGYSQGVIRAMVRPVGIAGYGTELFIALHTLRYVQVWDVGKRVATRQLHDPLLSASPLYAVAATDSHCYVGCHTYVVRLPLSGASVQHPAVSFSAGARATGLAVGRGELFVASQDRNSVFVYHLTTLAPLRTLVGSSATRLVNPYGVSFHGDALFVAEQGQARVHVMNALTGETLRLLDTSAYGRAPLFTLMIGEGDKQELLITEQTKGLVMIDPMGRNRVLTLQNNVILIEAPHGMAVLNGELYVAAHSLDQIVVITPH